MASSLSLDWWHHSWRCVDKEWTRCSLWNLCLTHTHTQIAPAREAPAARTRRTDDDTDDGEEEEEDYEEDEDDGDNNKRGHRNLKKGHCFRSRGLWVSFWLSGLTFVSTGSSGLAQSQLSPEIAHSKNKSIVIDCLACANQVSKLSSIQWTCYLLFLNFIWTWLLRSFVHLNRNTSLTRLRTIPFLRCQAGASDFGTEAWCSRPL